MNAPETLTVDSLVLGSLTVPVESVFTFTDGLHGFAEYRDFVIVPAARRGLYWMQSTIERAIAFLLVDPFVVAAGYELDLAVGERSVLDVHDASELLVLAIVTLPALQTQLPTANLRGPLVFNTRTRCARQVLSAVPTHEVQAPVNVLELPARAATVV